MCNRADAKRPYVQKHSRRKTTVCATEPTPRDRMSKSPPNTLYSFACHVYSYDFVSRLSPRPKTTPSGRRAFGGGISTRCIAQTEALPLWPAGLWGVGYLPSMVSRFPKTTPSGRRAFGGGSVPCILRKAHDHSAPVYMETHQTEELPLWPAGLWGVGTPPEKRMWN